MKASAAVDLAILGGGCAGLSLARYLTRQPSWDKPTLIIEARSAYHPDRSWCFWQPLDMDLRRDCDDLISHRWSRWRFSGAQFSQIHQVAEREYCYIAAEQFYRVAQLEIAQHPSMQLQLGCTVSAIETTANGYCIQCSDGSCIEAKQIVDTRPKKYTHSAQACLWQIFYGMEIRAASPLFDYSTVGLMEELTASTRGCEFLYVLPFSPEHALIEWTVFTPTLHTPAVLHTQLQARIDHQLHGELFTVLRTEQACLPMGLRALPMRNANPLYVYGGQVAGAIRPATGYAFLRIQRWARHIAKRLAENESAACPLQSKALTRAMDAIFLRVLHDTPQRGAIFFRALAERVAPSVLIRFLSDEANWLDHLQIMRALPMMQFVIDALGINRWGSR